MHVRLSHRTLLPAFTAVLIGTGLGPVPGAHADERITIVAFGDSTTAPRTVDGEPLRVYADILRDELPDRGVRADVINAGVGGNTTEDGRKRFGRDVLDKTPDLVVIQFGANDAAVDVWKDPPATQPRVDLKTYEKNLRFFVRALREKNARVILMPPTPFRWTAKSRERYGKPPYDVSDPDGFNVLLRKYAETVRRIAGAEDAELIDMYAAFAAYDQTAGRSMDDLLLDGVHPNATGHRMAAERLVRQITKMAGAGAATGQAKGNRRPNILIAISDDQSHPHASAYGCRWVLTPAFDRVAGEGILFTQAFAASPGCSPSRAALLTGRYPWQLEHAGTHASSFDPKYAVFPTLLENAGYVVGHTGKGWGPGNFKAGGFTRSPAGPDYDRHTIRQRPEGISGTDYARNFERFLKKRNTDQPFCFWFGGYEPHRKFEKGVGIKNGGRLQDVAVPPFLPDTPEVRSDLLDYAFEIEWFDRHLGRMLEALERAGELDNTLVIVTSDNGMAFPRAKANTYEYGIHMPLAIRWPAQVKGSRVVDDLVSLVDLAPTILEAAGVEHPGATTGKLPMAGRSLMNILRSDKGGVVDPTRTAVFSARERHSSSRYDNLGYPQRCMRTAEYLYIRNFRPERWPAGAPRKYEADGTLGPRHGGYHDIDACPTLSFLIEHRDDEKIGRFFHLAVDKRPAEELYDVHEDPGCLKNLADDPASAEIKSRLVTRFETFLRESGDPRILDGGDIFETYKRYSKIRRFPPPK